MKYSDIQEEEVKNRISQDFFSKFDCTKILGKIDFAVKIKRPANTIDFPDEYLLWAEAKKDSENIISMLAQLVITIGKARTFNEILPPAFLGCFDSEKIAFIPYSEIQDIFYQNDFNWNVAPSNTKTKEFQLVYNQIDRVINNDIPFNTYIFYFEKDEKDLRQFIKENFVIGKSDATKIKIDKNNFLTIYNKWYDAVKPTIGVNWDAAKKIDIIDADFYLADLLSFNNETIREKLFVLLKSNLYKYNKQTDDLGEIFREAYFTDNQKAYNHFWAKYERPPLEEYWDYIINRRDLLVPQDIRERKGSFFTPRIWVELSQKYLADVFGENWQEEYYVWDCCAGTGNLLVGLTNKYNIWASTLDEADVDVMRDRIENGANLLDSHVFQFDFLNDDFSKLPQGLQDIINDEKRRKKLIIYINPPYAEATTARTTSGTGENKAKVATKHKTKDNYKHLIGAATNEISAHFMARIYNEISQCKLALFSKFKFVCTQNFIKFRHFFKADFEKGFAIHANTFDNVTGNFPIGFTIWDLAGKKFPEFIEVDVPEENIKKKFYDGFKQSINQWIKLFDDKRRHNLAIGYMDNLAPDFQRLHAPYIETNIGKRHANHFAFTAKNIVEGCVYFAVRLCTKPTWLNDRDQFYFPNKKWEKDTEFQNDCLAYTLFHSQNRISAKHGVNHWIPFMEKEVNAKDKFESHFMVSFISGKIIQNGYSDLFEQEEAKFCLKREFSPEATAVFDAGRELWKYYHKQKNINVNASLYDIKEYFKGRNEKGSVNQKSADKEFNRLNEDLNFAMKNLAQKIEPKIYEYEFLMN
ncbi:MAG: hypothetical protein FWD66_00795 [Paludibacter sp.]|nr:hypothetical protein [Paludibacter sp.]